MDMTEPLDDVVPNADVLDIVRASNSRHLLPAIAGIEDLEDAAVTLDNLQMLGMGLNSEELFKDVVLAVQHRGPLELTRTNLRCRSWRSALAMERADP